ncbi:MAG: hypothetical protein ABEJ06_04220 [Haloarculaceae archaeon]
MECQRCGTEGSLARYALGERVAVACERCGYVGVPVDHESEPAERESWEAALRRFFGE